MRAAAAIPGLDVPPWSLSPARAILGIDPSTRRMSVGILVPAAHRRRTEQPFVWDTLSLPQVDKNESRRLAWSQRELVPWLGDLLVRWDPELVVVETPFAHGRLVPVESFHVIGILLAVLGTFGVRVERMGPSTWKKMALGAGSGGVKKPGRHDDFEYAVLAWARAAGYGGVSWDEADALAMATAGGVLLDREARAA